MGIVERLTKIGSHGTVTNPWGACESIVKMTGPGFLAFIQN